MVLQVGTASTTAGAVWIAVSAIDRRDFMARFHRTACSFLLCATASAQQYIISTYAGGAPPPTPAAAMTVHIGWARGVAADGAGNVYFASADLNAVFKLNSNGIVTRVAGNSRPGFAGDGGPATNAQLNTPISVAIDGNGNLFIADFSESEGSQGFAWRDHRHRCGRGYRRNSRRRRSTRKRNHGDRWCRQSVPCEWLPRP